MRKQKLGRLLDISTPTKIPMRKIFLVLILLALPLLSHAGTDTRTISTEPKEIYGPKNAEIKIRIGNGGAGPTGILRALSEDYLEVTGKNYAIAWYQNITIHTLNNLQNGVIDIALVYEKQQADVGIKEGWATNYTPVFNDHFLIIGPKTNPAKLKKSDSPELAFQKIAKIGNQNLKPIFVSRDDNSGTNVKEQSIWEMAKIKPWQGDVKWYAKQHVFPKDALVYADKNSLYTMTDWGTWLSNEKDLRNSKIYLRGGPTLLNPCFALLGAKPSAEVFEFLNYLKSEHAQKLIAEFGKNKLGKALFTKASQQDF